MGVSLLQPLTAHRTLICQSCKSVIYISRALPVWSQRQRTSCFSNGPGTRADASRQRRAKARNRGRGIVGGAAWERRHRWQLRVPPTADQAEIIREALVIRKRVEVPIRTSNSQQPSLPALARVASTLETRWFSCIHYLLAWISRRSDLPNGRAS
jgi:hypothetical protein